MGQESTVICILQLLGIADSSLCFTLKISDAEKVFIQMELDLYTTILCLEGLVGEVYSSHKEYFEYLRGKAHILVLLLH